MDLIQKKTTKTKMVNRVALRRNIMQSLEDLDPIFLTYVVQDPNLYRDRFVLEFLRRSVETQRDDLLEKLVELKFTTPAEITDLFILYNLFPVAEERIQNGILPTHEAELCAAMNLDITALEFLEKHGFHPTNRGFDMAIGAGGFREQYDNRTRILDWYAQRGLRPSTPIKPIDMEDDEDGQIRTWLDTHQIPIEGN